MKIEAGKKYNTAAGDVVEITENTDVRQIEEHGWVFIGTFVETTKDSIFTVGGTLNFTVDGVATFVEENNLVSEFTGDDIFTTEEVTIYVLKPGTYGVFTVTEDDEEIRGSLIEVGDFNSATTSNETLRESAAFLLKLADLNDLIDKKNAEENAE